MIEIEVEIDTEVPAAEVQVCFLEEEMSVSSDQACRLPNAIVPEFAPLAFSMRCACRVPRFWRDSVLL